MSPDFCPDETEDYRQNGDNLGNQSSHDTSNDADEKWEQYDYIKPSH